MGAHQQALKVWQLAIIIFIITAGACGHLLAADGRRAITRATLAIEIGLEVARAKARQVPGCRQHSEPARWGRVITGALATSRVQGGDHAQFVGRQQLAGGAELYALATIRANRARNHTDITTN